jgi:hypothetical protein
VEWNGRRKVSLRVSNALNLDMVLMSVSTVKLKSCSQRGKKSRSRSVSTVKTLRLTFLGQRFDEYENAFTFTHSQTWLKQSFWDWPNLFIITGVFKNQGTNTLKQIEPNQKTIIISSL